MNYATLGAYAAHALTHHFDDKGSRRDQQERLLDWWSPTTRAHFDSETACFVQQYSKAVDLQTGKTVKRLRSLFNFNHKVVFVLAKRRKISQ